MRAHVSLSPDHPSTVSCGRAAWVDVRARDDGGRTRRGGIQQRSSGAPVRAPPSASASQGRMGGPRSPECAILSVSLSFSTPTGCRHAYAMRDVGPCARHRAWPHLRGAWCVGSLDDVVV